MLTIPHISRLLALAALVFHGSAAASDYQPFGLTLIPEATAIAMLGTAPTAGDKNPNIEAWTRRLNEIEAREGPYAAELAEVLFEAALDAEQRGADGKALEYYGAALQNTRINNGLYGEDQLPIVERMLGLLRRTGDLEGLGSRVEYLYRLSGYGQPPYSAERIDVAQRWLQVQIELLMASGPTVNDAELLDTYQQTQPLVDTLCTHQEWQQTACKPLTLTFLNLLYILDYRVNPVIEEQWGNSIYSARYQAQRQWQENPGRQQLVNLERSAFNRGRELLERALTIDPEDDELQLARADWEWFSKRRRPALRQYREIAGTNPEQLRHPAPLPAIPEMPRDPRFTDRWQRITVSATITARGRPRDIMISTDSEVAPMAISEDAELTAFARHQFRQLRFRPAFNDDGEPIDSQYEARLVVLK